MMGDFDVLKEIPGYRAILKSVLKSQIQLLLEQLSEHAGEESVILTACVHDGSLCQLGSNNGKGFLEGREEIKSQFLGYILKSHNKQRCEEPLSMSHHSYRRARPHPYMNNTSTEGLNNRRLNNNRAESQYVLPMEDNHHTAVDNQYNHSVKASYENSIVEQGDNIEEVQVPENSDSGQGVAQCESPDSNSSSVVINTSIVKLEPVNKDELDTDVEWSHNLPIIEDNWNQGLDAGSSANQGQRLPAIQPNSTMWLYHRDAHNDGDTVINKLDQLADQANADKSYHCKICGKNFKHASWLERHVLIHTGDKPYHCGWCERSFRQKGHLKIHIFTVHKKCDTSGNVE